MENEKEVIEMPMKYCNFFINIYLAIVVILCIIALINNLQYIQNIQNENIQMIFFIMIIASVVIQIVLPIVMRDKIIQRFILGYRLVIMFLILDYIYRISISTFSIYLNYPKSNLEIYIVIYTILYGVWYIPNLIYFLKRKSIFKNNKK